MSFDPHARTEDVTMTYIPFTKPPRSIPVIRQQEVDWRALTDAEQAAVRDWQVGRAPASILPPRARTYVGRHHPATRES